MYDTERSKLNKTEYQFKCGTLLLVEFQTVPICTDSNQAIHSAMKGHYIPKMLHSGESVPMLGVSTNIVNGLLSSIRFIVEIGLDSNGFATFGFPSVNKYDTP